MTQLNLSGRPSNNPQQKPAVEPANESIKNQTVGALGALAMFAAVIVVGSCSSSKPVAVQQPVQPAAPVTAPVSAIPAPAPPAPPAPVAAKAKKAKAKKHRAATLSYVNREYGLSFNFPRNYQLKTDEPATSGNETHVAAGTAESLPMDFSQAGGVMLAAVKMPTNSYPGTDFRSGVVNVGVHPAMTAEACARFAAPAANTGTEVSTPEKIEQVKFGATEFHEAADTSQTLTKQADAKYYHAFNNGVCYEFALAVATDAAGNGELETVTPVDRQAVFARLEKILATVKLQAAAMPETPAPVPATTATAPADSAGTVQPQAAPNF